MASHGRARALVAAASVAALASVGVLTTSAHATTTMPTLSPSSTKSNYVRVAWTFSVMPTRAVPSLLERSTDGATYTTLFTLRHLHGNSSRLDRHAPASKLWYRMCLIADPTTCSAAATIDHSNGTTGGGGGGTGGDPTKYGNCPSSSGITDLIGLINADRKKVGAPPLREDSRLDAAALTHSKRHIKDHSNAGQEITDAGYHWTTWGQNIGWGYRTASSFESDLFAEGPPPPGQWNHYANIVDRNFTDVGVACDDYYWTEDFAAGG